MLLVVPARVHLLVQHPLPHFLSPHQRKLSVHRRLIGVPPLPNLRLEHSLSLLFPSHLIQRLEFPLLGHVLQMVLAYLDPVLPQLLRHHPLCRFHLAHRVQLRGLLPPLHRQPLVVQSVIPSRPCVLRERPRLGFGPAHDLDLCTPPNLFLDSPLLDLPLEHLLPLILPSDVFQLGHPLRFVPTSKRPPVLEDHVLPFLFVSHHLAFLRCPRRRLEQKDTASGARSIVVLG